MGEDQRNVAKQTKDVSTSACISSARILFALLPLPLPPKRPHTYTCIHHILANDPIVIPKFWEGFWTEERRDNSLTEIYETVVLTGFGTDEKGITKRIRRQ